MKPKVRIIVIHLFYRHMVVKENLAPFVENSFAVW